MIPHMDTSRAQFNRCIPVILAAEGGLVHHTADPGGLTKYGISQRSYPALDIATRQQMTIFTRRLSAGKRAPKLDFVGLYADIAREILHNIAQSAVAPCHSKTTTKR
jgi:hypothetical protein